MEDYDVITRIDKKDGQTEKIELIAINSVFVTTLYAWGYSSVCATP